MPRLHEIQEALEVKAGVHGARRRFGVILDGEDRQGFVGQTLDRAVVEVDLADGERIFWERARVKRVAVVLRRDHDATRGQVLDRMIRAPVAKRELEGTAAKRTAQKLDRKSVV